MSFPAFHHLAFFSQRLHRYLPTPPYQDNVSLHVYAGLICIFLAQPGETEASTQTSLAWNEGALRQARQYLERAVLLDSENVVAKSWLEKVCSC